MLDVFPGPDKRDYRNVAPSAQEAAYCVPKSLCWVLNPDTGPEQLFLDRLT